MVAENLSRIKQRLMSACNRVGRDPRGITLVAVTKGRNVEAIKEVLLQGITDIGENRVGEAQLKYGALNRIGLTFPKWHMVGHLQTNKVRDALAIFELIHSVDSVRLARCISRAALDINKIQDILIEVNTSAEPTKSGIKPDQAVEVVGEILTFRNVRVKGLMTIAKKVDNPEASRPYFKMLRDLSDKLYRSLVIKIPELSMGMSDDFEVAVEEGATIIRLGRAIFA